MTRSIILLVLLAGCSPEPLPLSRPLVCASYHRSVAYAASHDGAHFSICDSYKEDNA